MSPANFPFRLYLVISERSCVNHDMMTLTEEAVKGGVDIVQLREKEASTQEFSEKAFQLQDILTRYNVPLIINDNLGVAKDVNAYGIHVGNHDVAPSQIRSQWRQCQLLGYSIEYKEQLYTSQSTISDYLAVSPVFNSVTKKDTVREWGLEGIREIRSITSKPLVAIGNMNASNVYDVIQAGADCIAVASAICQSKNPSKAAFEIRNQIEKAL